MPPAAWWPNFAVCWWCAMDNSDRIPFETEPISRLTLALFAGASGDHNPIHVDLDFARAAGMDDVFAHGMLSMAYLGRMLTELDSADGIARVQRALHRDHARARSGGLLGPHRRAVRTRRRAVGASRGAGGQPGRPGEGDGRGRGRMEGRNSLAADEGG